MPTRPGRVLRSAFGVLAAALLPAGCDSARDAPQPDVAVPVVLGGPDIPVDSEFAPTSPDTLLSDAEDTHGKGRMNSRLQAQRQAAMRHGSQAGYRHRARELGEILGRNSSKLSAIFDFNRVVWPAPAGTGYLLPPVVQRSGPAFNSSDEGQTVSVADRYLEILEPARIEPVVPNWRQYLLFWPPEPVHIPPTLVPRSDAERIRVRGWIGAGWSAGAAQAEDELARRMRRLQRHYEGMLDFRRLLALGMIEQVDTETVRFGITGESGIMRIGDRTVQIANDPDFRRDPNHWRSLPSMSRSATWHVGAGLDQ